MLEIKNVVCGYKNNVILSDISFGVNKGSILSIMGANGIGKTTLFKTILGHLKLLDGEILLHGKAMKSLTSKEMAKQIAYVPQAHIPPFPFKVIDVVAMGRTSHISVFRSPSKKDMQIAQECLNTVNILYLQEKSYTEISGGERQLVLIARALAQKSEILIMDEPTANLDFGNQTRILDQIRALSKKGLTIIYTTHFPEHAFLCSSQVLVIKGKKEFVIGSASEIITSELIKEVYQVDALVKEIKLDFKTVKICVPQ
ncbi:ABC transporter ATP-binding protein [[Clostridium] fimetarium]|uniref:Iron complex transport system ATP-binding protein n=1 Tax=[Clostridium] fimetarium TaxID=99656 RepID=A0A1I0RXF5_9FIRM|nr:ABC transporter ATP-binding protein [[Clostridium] fimetarium]SEW46180.1 iron complex transport system ATP-binding protein [[Clostridium] fimetarium]